MMGKIVATAGLVGVLGIAYLGGICNVPGMVEQARYGNAAPAQGFYAKPYELKIDVTRNKRGELESYLVTSENRLPVLQGARGAQVGDNDYSWQNLQPEQQRAYVVNGFEKMDAAKKAELVVQSWRQLDTNTRFEIVKGDLGVLVEGVFEGLKARFR